jgi:hypothetical protein
MSEGNGQPPGPSQETLKHLHAFMPSFAQAVAEKKIGGKGRKEPPRVPRNVCPVCGTGSDYGPMTKPLPDAVTCKDCQRDLDQGFTAFICGDRYCIAKHPMLPDMAGKIVPLSLPIFTRITEKHTAKTKAATTQHFKDDEVAGSA